MACPHNVPHPSQCNQCNPAVVVAQIYGIAVEGGKNVVCIIVNGSKLTIDTNIIGFASLARAGVKVLTVQR